MAKEWGDVHAAWSSTDMYTWAWSGSFLLLRKMGHGKEEFLQSPEMF